MAAYYSINEADKPASERRYHDNEGCPPGGDIPARNRRSGSNGYRLCGQCNRMNKAEAIRRIRGK
jgi:hypothetical protein